MDTLLEKSQFVVPSRTCEYVLTFSLFTALVLTHMIFQPPLFANDLIANTSINAPSLKEMTEYIKEEINPEVKKEKFEARIAQKYRGLTINNIADGVKHIRLVKYYNGVLSELML